MTAKDSGRGQGLTPDQRKKEEKEKQKHCRVAGSNPDPFKSRVKRSNHYTTKLHWRTKYQRFLDDYSMNTTSIRVSENDEIYR